MPLSCYVPSQIIPKSRVVHLADKQILKRHILCYPKIIVTKIPPPPGGGGGGRVSRPGPWTNKEGRMRRPLLLTQRFPRPLLSAAIVSLDQIAGT